MLEETHNDRRKCTKSNVVNHLFIPHPSIIKSKDSCDTHKTRRPSHSSFLSLFLSLTHMEGLLSRLLEYLRSCTPLVYENRKVLASHAMYEITPAHYPLASYSFQPYSSTSRTPSLHGLSPAWPSYHILEDCPLFSETLFFFISFFYVDP